MSLAPLAMDDPTAALAQSAARAAVQVLLEDLVAARSQVAAARDEMPRVTLDWFGPASDALAASLVQLTDRVVEVHDDLDAAIELLRSAL